MIFSNIFPKQDVIEMGQYDSGFSAGLSGLWMGMMVAVFQSDDT
jgi:hypothetical protein